MVSPRDAMEVVATSVSRSNKLPPEMSLLLHEADSTSSDADVDLPLLEVRPVEVEHVVLNNSDRVGFVTNDNGERIGRVYFSEYEMMIRLDIWTSADSSYDPDDLGERLRQALYRHSSYGPQEPLVDENGEPVEQITYFRLDNGERIDDLIQTPTVRRWSQEVELWSYEEFRTTGADPIGGVTFPESGDLSGSGNGEISNT